VILPDWDFVALEDLVQSRGDSVILETGVACTCRATDSTASLTTKENQPATLRRFNCTTCGGDGYIYRNARCAVGLVTSIQSGANRKLLEAGYAVAGDCVFSPSAAAGAVGDFDKVTFTTSAFVGEGQVIFRQGAFQNENNSLSMGLARNEDQLWYYADCAIWCEDQNGVVYSQGSDFVFDKKVIRWIGNSPNPGIFYTIKYKAFLEWIAYSTPMARIDVGRTLGQRVILRKKHVAYSTGSSAETPLDRQIEQQAFTTRTKV
jgi:hypothetical protein